MDSDIFNEGMVIAEGNSFKEYHAALEAYFRKIFPDTPQPDEPPSLNQIFISSYPELEQRLDTPALILECAHLSASNGDGTTRVTFGASFEARIAVASTTENAQMLVRDYAIKIAGYLHREPFPIPGHGIARNITIEYDDLDTLGDSYLVWVVKWSMDLFYNLEEWVPE